MTARRTPRTADELDADLRRDAAFARLLTALVEHADLNHAAVPTGDREEQIRARLAAATPGPWIGWSDTGEVTCDPNGDREPEDHDLVVQVYGPHRPNTDLIANAPTDLAWLLDELDTARATVAALHEKVNILFARQLGADC